MNISELKELIADEGKKVSAHALKVLDAARHARVGFSISRQQLNKLRLEYDSVQHEFREYDRSFWSYLGMSTRPAGTNEIDEDGNEVKVFHPDVHGPLSQYASYLLAQRASVTTTLRDITDQINTLEAQATINLTVWLAALSLLVAVVSLVISGLALRH